MTYPTREHLSSASCATGLSSTKGSAVVGTRHRKTTSSCRCEPCWFSFVVMGGVFCNITSLQIWIKDGKLPVKAFYGFALWCSVTSRQLPTLFLPFYLQATMGLYEGESSLYFMIAQGDLDTVKWLLEKKARFFVEQTRIFDYCNSPCSCRWLNTYIVHSIFIFSSNFD
jgi:hypothetical protein